MGLIFLKRVRKLGTQICPKFRKFGPNRTSDKENGDHLLRNRLQRVWERHGMGLGP